MRLEPLYRMRFTYPEGWVVDLEGEGGTQEQHFFLAEGACEGRVTGRVRAANHPQRRTDRTFVPDLQGVIEVDDDTVVFFDMRGYGRAYPPGRREVVVAITHLADAERFRWLNDTMAVGTGEVRADEGAEAEIVIEVAELVWEPIAP